MCLRCSRSIEMFFLRWSTTIIEMVFEHLNLTLTGKCRQNATFVLWMCPTGFSWERSPSLRHEWHLYPLDTDRVFVRHLYTVWYNTCMCDRFCLMNFHTSSWRTLKDTSTSSSLGKHVCLRPTRSAQNSLSDSTVVSARSWRTPTAVSWKEKNKCFNHPDVFHGKEMLQTNKMESSQIIRCFRQLKSSMVRFMTW